MQKLSKKNLEGIIVNPTEMLQAYTLSELKLNKGK